jgi:hypothetical protein
MYDLNDLLVDSLGWTLYQAYGINDSGQIVANGYDINGNYHALRLDPFAETPGAETPEPATLTLFGSGLLIGGIAVRRKRRAGRGVDTM